MKPGQIEYTYKNGVPVVRHGGGVSEADLKLHRDMAWQSGNDAVNQVKGDILKPVTSFFNFGNKPQGNQPRVGTLGYEFGREDVKHQMRADNAQAQAQELRQKGDVAGAQRLEQQAQGYRQQAQDYAHVANNPALRHQKGDGYVANDRDVTLDQRNLLSRDVANDLLRDPRVKTIGDGMSTSPGTKESPIPVPDGGGILGLVHQFSSGQRTPANNQRSYYQIGSTRVSEQQKDGVNNAYVSMKPSNYF